MCYIVRRNRVARILLCFLALVTPGLMGVGCPPVTAQEPPDQRCFPETDYCISGAIRDYWEQHGGVPVFGFPITPLRTETIGGWTGPVQWFERDRLEDHGIQGVRTGRLGAELLDLQGRPWFLFSPVSNAPEMCAYFMQTKHSLCEPFLSYWQEHGGVERLGYPITEAFGETLSSEWSGSVQYFERRRLEWHTELPGRPVLPGLLGREVLDVRTTHQPVVIPVPTATPIPAPTVPIPTMTIPVLPADPSPTATAPAPPPTETPTPTPEPPSAPPTPTSIPIVGREP
jgi:hypothetical protein